MPEEQSYQPPLALQRGAPLFEEFPESDTYAGDTFWREFGVVPEDPKPESGPAKLQFSPTLFGDLAQNTNLFEEEGTLVRNRIEVLEQHETQEAHIERILTGSALGILHELTIICIRECILKKGPRGLFSGNGNLSPSPVLLTYQTISEYYPTGGAFSILTITDALNQHADKKDLFEQVLAAWCDIRALYQATDPRGPKGKWRNTQWFSGEFIRDIWNSDQITAKGRRLIEDWKDVLAMSPILPGYVQPIHHLCFQPKIQVPVSLGSMTPTILLSSTPDCLLANTALKGRGRPLTLAESAALTLGISAIDHKLDIGKETSPENLHRNEAEAALSQLVVCAYTTSGGDGIGSNNQVVRGPRDKPFLTAPIMLRRTTGNNPHGDQVEICPFELETGELHVRPGSRDPLILNPHPIMIYLQGLEPSGTRQDFRLHPLISPSTENRTTDRMWQILTQVEKYAQEIRHYRAQRRGEITWDHPRLIPEGGWAGWKYRLNVATGELREFN